MSAPPPAAPLKSTPGEALPAIPVAERPIAQLRGTRDWLPADFSRLRALETQLLGCFARAGYEPLRTPVLEYTELHERKSGAGIVSKLYELADARLDRLCLRPELTASIVRAFTAAEIPPPIPWRVSMSGSVFRHEADPRADRLREFQQVGVELLGAAGPVADAEVIALADATLREIGIGDATVRIGHVGLILEMLDRSGLPPAARSALVEILSEAAAEGGDVRALEAAVARLAEWLRPSEADQISAAVSPGEDGEVERLFRHLVPDVTGRRTSHEIIARLRRKWELGRSLHGVLGRMHEQIHELANLRGPAVEILDRLERDYRTLAPDSVAALRELVALLASYGVVTDRVELDLGFGRGIGFYSRMIFELAVPLPAGPVEVCGGGRYDGLARVLGSDRDDRGVGFAFGLERLASVCLARGLAADPWESNGVLVIPQTTAWQSESVALALRLRQRGARAVLESPRGLDEACERAGCLGFARIVIVRGSLSQPGSLLASDPRHRQAVAITIESLERDLETPRDTRP